MTGRLKYNDGNPGWDGDGELDEWRIWDGKSGKGKGTGPLRVKRVLDGIGEGIESGGQGRIVFWERRRKGERWDKEGGGGLWGRLRRGREG